MNANCYVASFTRKMASVKGKAPLGAKKDKVAQEEFRKLMREKQSTSSKKIESPLAKYNNLGQLVCVLCNLKIKNELLWTAHVNGRNHKETLSRLKKKKDVGNNNQHFSNNNTTTDNRRLSTSTEIPQILKRSNSSDADSVAEKKLKVDGKSTVTQRKIRVSFSLSDDEEEEKPRTQDVELPLENVDMDLASADATPLTTTNTVLPRNKTSSTNLPEGFFDDPFLDAKVRKVEYKDPMDDEWEKFQKVISEASTASQAMVDENDEEMKTEREIDEIEEQIHNWARVEALQQQKEQCLTNLDDMSSDDQIEENPIENEDDLDDLLNWRAKRAWR